MILQPPSCLLAGPPGSGKTSSLATQLLCGLRVFVIVTEPDGIASLLDAAERIRAPIDKLHWSFCPPAAAGWMELEDMITKISSMDQKQLADQRDMGKSSFRPAAMKFLEALRNFKCDRTGREFGDFTQWDHTCSLNIDGLTGWSEIGFGCTVGFKPTANPGEWGIAQNFIFKMLMKINSDRQCYFNMTTHIEKEADELQGIKRVMVSTIGAKLAPKVPTFFSEVIRCKREMIEGNRAAFTWATLDDQMDLKNRSLPIGSKLKADFKPVIDAYERRRRLAQEAETKAQPELADGLQSPPSNSVALGPNATPVLPAAPMTPRTTNWPSATPNTATQPGEWK